MKSINEIIDNSAGKNPSKSAVIFDDLTLSYDELLQRTNYLSNFIQDKTKPGKVVSLLYENSPFFIISYFSILKSGCIAHIIPPAISDFNLKEQIRETNPEIIISSNNFKHKLNRTEVIKEIFFLDNDSKFFKSNDDFYGNQFNETSSIIFTSGTTSKPKGVKLTHKNVLTATNNIVKMINPVS